jgi:flagellar biosynthetic protein FliS
MYTKANAIYKNTNALHALALSPAEQVARLLETAAKHILRAKGHAEREEFIERYQATEDAMKIIAGLQGCLAYEGEAAEVSNVLQGYYSTLTLMITRINVQNDLKVCDDTIASLHAMAETWRRIGEQTKTTLPETKPTESVSYYS